MRVWRICRPEHARFDGEGARLVGGRWNRIGASMVYTASSLSLAVLELLVHLDLAQMPSGLVSIPADIPDSLHVETLTDSDLPAGWADPGPPRSTQALGTAWLKRGATAVFSVPSVVVPIERNYLLNPAHRDFSKIRIGAPVPLEVDRRLR
ncbi:MAG: RES family NAD+ phosphorylase [Bryobacteraceae bacterium]|jgi:RES domain-containing protein